MSSEEKRAGYSSEDDREAMIRVANELSNVVSKLNVVTAELRILQDRIVGTAADPGIVTRLAILENQQKTLWRIVNFCLGTFFVQILGAMGAILWWLINRIP